MGTRGLVKVSNGTKEVNLYNHFDSYPECLGEDLKEFFSGINIETFKEKFKETKKSRKESYYVGRAVKVLTSILESEEPLTVHDSKNYEKGDTDCQWFYEVDLEKKHIITYKNSHIFSKENKPILKDLYKF